MVSFGWLSVLPPLLAIGLALATRQVYLSLLCGVLLGTTVLAGWNPLTGAAETIEQLIHVLNQHDSAEVVLFGLLAGALIALTRESGGVEAFADWTVNRRWVRGPRSAQIISILLGISLFVESSLTCLVTGAASRPIYDRFRLSRAKLAYVCDATSAPICMLLPLNAWGALMIGLLSKQGVDNPLQTLLGALPLNFYALAALGLVVFVALTGWHPGAMGRAEATARQAGMTEAAASHNSNSSGAKAEPSRPKRALNMLLPLATTVAMMPIGLWITGKGEILSGSGSTAVLWAVASGIAVAMLLYRVQRIFTLSQSMEVVLRGMQELLGAATILVLALALGRVCRQLGTGHWVASTTAPLLGRATVAPIVFLTGALISFATGSSWGTFAILVPIAVPLANSVGSSLALTTGAVMGGGVFGDHCSPISDTTVISSLAAGCDHIEHVTTQLPYALLAGAAATLVYLGVGLL
jgi:tetracycline resistance efflux pump